MTVEMGNPQERSIEWFTGVMEAEGSISVQVYTLPSGRVRLTPYVCIVNTDEGILAECEATMSELVKDRKDAKPRRCKMAGTNKPCFNIRIDGKAVQPILEAMLPHMRSEKRRNAEVLLEFLAGRRERLILRDEKSGRLQRQGYTREEIELVSSIRTHKVSKSSEAICQAPNVVG